MTFQCRYCHQVTTTKRITVKQKGICETCEYRTQMLLANEKTPPQMLTAGGVRSESVEPNRTLSITDDAKISKLLEGNGAWREA